MKKGYRFPKCHKCGHILFNHVWEFANPDIAQGEKR